MGDMRVEKVALGRRNQIISVNSGERACINCIWYERYYRENRGNIQHRVLTSTGYCLLHEQQRGALRQPCKDFEKEGE